jgi:uncharacterized protein (UPF0264 family)
MTRLLASVASLSEARWVAASDVDIVDLKNPARGALGAMPVEAVAAIVAGLRGVKPVSATIGDLPMDPTRVIPAVEAMAATDVDYVKIGFFPGGDWPAVLSGLQPLAASGARLIAVLFADCEPDRTWLAELARAGFAGAMLDTADKSRGSLRTISTQECLREFVTETRRLGLLCGLAGSLRAHDVPPLLALSPDYLGFRGALCGGVRTDALDPAAVRSLTELIHRSPAFPH